MKTTIIYFSPTGTSAGIAAAIARGLGDCMEVEMIDVTKTAVGRRRFDSTELLIAATPVYGGHTPAIVRERMAAIAGDSTPAVAVAVYGNRAFEKAVTDMADFLSERGFIPVGGAAFVGEHSYSTASTPIAAGRPDARDLADAEAFGRAIAAALASGTCSRADLSALADEPAAPESVENFLAFVRGYQKSQAENPVRLIPDHDPKLCEGCGVCVEACPTGAISPDGFLTDAARCIKCCACVKSCPDGARTLNSPFAPVLSANFSARRSPVWII